MRLKSPPIPQSSYIDVEESNVPKQLIYREAVVRNSLEAHIVRFSHPNKIICGIACIPKDENTPSPVVELEKGGIGYNFVEIRLTPERRGNWACGVEILGREREM